MIDTATNLDPIARGILDAILTNPATARKRIAALDDQIKRHEAERAPEALITYARAARAYLAKRLARSPSRETSKEDQ